MLKRRWFAGAVGDEWALLEDARHLLESSSTDSNNKLIDLVTDTTRIHGPNLASALFYQYLMSHELHGQFIQRVQQEPIGPIDTTGRKHRPHIIVVPGMYADEKPELGGDGALLCDIGKTLGYSVTLAPTRSRNSLAQNATLLHNYLLHEINEPYWFVSISRGSADIKYMLHLHPNAPYLAQLTQWISVSGIVSGSPLVDLMRKRPLNSVLLRVLCKLNGASINLANELQCKQAHWQATTPDNCRITHVVPIPLDWHVTSAVLPRYQRLRHYGPTDGLCLLVDLLQQAGRIYPVWGADHLLRVPNLAHHFYQLINYLEEEEQ